MRTTHCLGKILVFEDFPPKSIENETQTFEFRATHACANTLHISQSAIVVNEIETHVPFTLSSHIGKFQKQRVERERAKQNQIHSDSGKKYRATKHEIRFWIFRFHSVVHRFLLRRLILRSFCAFVRVHGNRLGTYNFWWRIHTQNT